MLATVTAGTGDPGVGATGSSSAGQDAGDERGDDGVDAQGGRRRIPRGQPDPDPGEPALGADDGRHHEGLRAHRVQRRSGRCRRGSSWTRWRSTARSRARRSTSRTATTSGSWSRTSSTSRPSLHFHGMTVPNAQDGVPYITQDPIMPGQVWTLRVHGEGPAGHVRLPLALQLDGAGGRGPLRRAHRAAAGWALAVPGALGRRSHGRHHGRRARRPSTTRRRCSWATGRSATCSTASRSRRRRRSWRSRATGS